MTEYIQVMTAVGSSDEADSLARTLLSKRLAACVQIVGPVNSLFWWDDKIDRAEEYLCLIKSSRDRYQDLESEIKTAHSYEVPEILALPVIAGGSDYLGWLATELKNR